MSRKGEGWSDDSSSSLSAKQKQESSSSSSSSDSEKEEEAFSIKEDPEVSHDSASGKFDSHGIIAGDYTFVRSLNKSGFSAADICVYEKKKFGLIRQEFAVKKFRSNQLKEFENEVSIFQELKHFLTAEMVASNKEDLTIWMKLYKKSLTDIIGEDRNDSKDTIRQTKYLISAAYGLRYINNKGIIHRDIKPGNIFCGDKGRAVIGDFGFAIRERDLNAIPEKEKMVIGTDGFMAPEVLDGEYSDKSDAWAFGVTIFCVCTGRHPFNGGNIPREVKKPAQMPTLWYYLFKKCTIVDPSERYSMADVCQVIEEYGLAKGFNARRIKEDDEEFIPAYESGQAKEVSVYINDMKNITSHDSKSKKSIDLSEPKSVDKFFGGFFALILLYILMLAIPFLAKIDFSDWIAGRYQCGWSRTQLILYETFMLYLLMFVMNLSLALGGMYPLKHVFIWNAIFACTEILCCALRRFSFLVGLLSAIQLVSEFVLMSLSFWYRGCIGNGVAPSFAAFSWGYCEAILIWRFAYSVHEDSVIQAVGISLSAVSMIMTFMEPSQSIGILVLRVFGILISFAWIFGGVAHSGFSTILAIAYCSFFIASLIVDIILRCVEYKEYSYGHRTIGESFSSFTLWSVLIGDLVGALITITVLAGYHTTLGETGKVYSNAHAILGYHVWERYVLTVFGGIGFLLICLCVLVLFNKSLKKGLLLDRKRNEEKDPKRDRQVLHAQIGLVVVMFVGLFLFLLGLYLNIHLSDLWTRRVIYWLGLQLFCHYVFDIGHRILVVPVVLQSDIEIKVAFRIEICIHIFQFIVLGLCVMPTIISFADISNWYLLLLTAIMNTISSTFHSYCLCNIYRGTNTTKKVFWMIKWGCFHVCVCLVPIAGWFACMAIFWILIIGAIAFLITKLVIRVTTSKKVEPEKPSERP